MRRQRVPGPLLRPAIGLSGELLAGAEPLLPVLAIELGQHT